ncbi:polysaccharide deacetylase family protein [Salinimicrobium gaetbulicola]|uniref:Polysaccharide deacetylase family protein n=1 Tax=Salinimicrobium gaetbulicola TaxID=999702 RepID=A0ABW3ICN4_9FLAO
MDNGNLVISLDFELLWGVFDKVDHKEKVTYFKNTREVIPQILEVFSENGISCTWATVGMLFNKNWNEWSQSFPQELPSYDNANLNAYDFGRSIASNENASLCFAPELIRKISNTPGQELATHTYSHYYCSEKGQTPEAFKADLEMAISKAREMGIELKSLVFPRNQLNEDYLKICHNLGITSVRSNPSSWYWRDTEDSTFSKKLFRSGDAYFGKNDKSYPISRIKKVTGKPLEQPASRLLRPVSGFSFMNELKIKRIKSEMIHAAKNKEIYHLWWHPHNFGSDPERSMEELKEIVSCYRECNKKYGFKSLSMKDLSALVN